MRRFVVFVFHPFAVGAAEVVCCADDGGEGFGEACADAALMTLERREITGVGEVRGDYFVA
ncbi:hypothetical protein SAMN02745244_01808 [Tessaracoccus bendigoensis DSM 12906]|uniref:Uncharacterized protein n=1 Tax=Tessaracoccus bendigoensis DSM 12906 TaxID=1123357 RepID=A0A1M6GV86_9ACTN|nr:hypothetical protein [Tessaracoccus bendigoensis]SHJ13795.1 hypothetical protein SAMN02745244_01808 [Tessaracoccus bendigoensis DSM 12906]